MVSFERVFEALDLPEEIAEPADALRLGSVQGWVQFEGVSFSYQPGENVPGSGPRGWPRWPASAGAAARRVPPLSQESGTLRAERQAERPKSERADACRAPTRRRPPTSHRPATTQRAPTAIRAMRCAR